MIQPPLLVASLLGIAGGVVYSLIGWRYVELARRAHMQAFFALFWLGVGAYGVADAAWSLAVPLLDPPLAVSLLVLHLKILAGTAGFFGLVYYLAYLYTGRRGLFWPLLALYAVVYGVTTYAYVARHALGQEVRTWGSGLTYANPGGPVSNAAFLLLFAPPLLAALAYGALLPRASDRRRRLRILATSGALAVFFGGLLLGWMTDLVPAWPIVERALAIAAGLVVYACAPRPSECAPRDRAEGPAAAPMGPT